MEIFEIIATPPQPPPPPPPLTTSRSHLANLIRDDSSSDTEVVDIENIKEPNVEHLKKTMFSLFYVIIFFI